MSTYLQWHGLKTGIVTDNTGSLYQQEHSGHQWKNYWTPAFAVQGNNTGLGNPKNNEDNKICLTLKNAGSSTTALTPEDEERYAKNKKYSLLSL